MLIGETPASGAPRGPAGGTGVAVRLLIPSRITGPILAVPIAAGTEPLLSAEPIPGRPPMSSNVKPYPQAPQPPQTQTPPGLESEMNPAPLYMNTRYKGSNKLRDKVALIT